MLQIGAILFFAVIVSDSVRKSVKSHFNIHTFGAKSVISNHGSKCEFLRRFYLTRKAFFCQERKGYGASTADASAQRTANLHTKTAKEKPRLPMKGSGEQRYLQSKQMLFLCVKFFLCDDTAVKQFLKPFQFVSIGSSLHRDSGCSPDLCGFLSSDFRCIR